MPQTAWLRTLDAFRLPLYPAPSLRYYPPMPYEITAARKRPRGFEELAGQQLRVASRRGSPCALLYLDLDRFKAINDGWGHAEGDEALKATARLLEACFRAEDILARQGGDEFAAMLADSGEAAVLRLVERLKASTEAWNAGSGKPWRLGFSAGWVLFDPRNPVGLPELLSLADAAMYRAKRGGP